MERTEVITRLDQRIERVVHAPTAVVVLLNQMKLGFDSGLEDIPEITLHFVEIARQNRARAEGP